MTFGTLLYRYFFFGWLFKDVNKGSVFERSAALRHNRDMARWLPTYMRRWLWCGLGFYLLGGMFEWMLNAPGVSVLFYVPSALSVPVNAVIGAAWTLIASGGFLFDVVMASRADDEVARARAASERLNADLQARLETAVVRMSATTGGLEDMAQMVERRHAALSNVMGMFRGVDGARSP